MWTPIAVDTPFINQKLRQSDLLQRVLDMFGRCCVFLYEECKRNMMCGQFRRTKLPKVIPEGGCVWVPMNPTTLPRWWWLVHLDGGDDHDDNDHDDENWDDQHHDGHDGWMVLLVLLVLVIIPSSSSSSDPHQTPFFGQALVAPETSIALASPLCVPRWCITRVVESTSWTATRKLPPPKTQGLS